MKRPLRLLLLLGALAGLVAAAAGLRRRLSAPVPLGRAAPAPPEGEPAAPEPAPAPEPRAAPPAPPAADDLAEVWGIGPVYRGRLAEAGITTFAALAAAPPAAVAAATGVPEERAADWIAQAAAHSAD